MGCSLFDEDLGSCVLSCSGCGNGGYSIIKCYQGVYEKKECMDKEVTSGSRTYSYSSYSDTETCSEYCDGYAGTQYVVFPR